MYYYNIYIYVIIYIILFYLCILNCGWEITMLWKWLIKWNNGLRHFHYRSQNKCKKLDKWGRSDTGI